MKQPHSKIQIMINLVDPNNQNFQFITPTGSIRRFSVSVLILLTIVHPDGNETKFSRALLDADERTLSKIIWPKKYGLLRVKCGMT